MPLSDANPFFQEFHHVFKDENLGMRIRKVNNLPVVQELVRSKHGFKGAAEKFGVPVGSLLAAVNREFTLRQDYEETVAKIKAQGRPVTLGFRQLHAAEDRGEERRYWQGYLRVKVSDKQWTGRFYVLREGGNLIAYPGKDIQDQQPVEVINVKHSTVVHGSTLKQFAGRLLVDDPNDPLLLATGFAVLVKDQMLFFRAENPEAKLDWVSALTVLYTVQDLGLANQETPRPWGLAGLGSVPASQGGTPRGRSPSPRGRSSSFAFGSVGRGAQSDGSGGGTVAVGSARAAVANRVKQGYLQKRGGSKLWDTGGFHLAKTAIKVQGWNQRWFVLQDDGRLLWYKDVPSDTSEVPNGHLSLRGAMVTCDEEALKEHLREDEIHAPKSFAFLLRTGTRLLFLRAKTEQERQDWVTAVAAVADPSHGLYPGLAKDVEMHRRQMLKNIQEQPLLLFNDAETAYSLMVGTGVGGGVLREEFQEVAGQHFIPLCDAYTAEAVFDALCRTVETKATESTMATGLESIQQSITDLISEASGDDVRTRTVRAEPLTVGLGRMTFEVFQKYVRAVQTCARPPDAWDDLRVSLGLDPLEVLVLSEDYVAEKSQLFNLALTDSGTLYLTDRHMYLHLGLKQQCRVIPLSSVREVRQATSRVGPMTLQDSVELIGCQVHTVDVSPKKPDDADGEEGKETLRDVVKNSAKAPTLDYRLVFSTVKDMFANTDKLGGARRIWMDFLREMVAAHRVSEGLSRGEGGWEQWASVVDELAAGKHLAGGSGGKEAEDGHSRPPMSSDSAVAAADSTLSPEGAGGSEDPDWAAAPPIRQLGPKRSTIGRLAAKIRLLMREDENSLESYRVQQNRLHVWVAANLIRTRAILKVTGLPVHSLMICSNQQQPRNRKVLQAFLFQDDTPSAIAKAVSTGAKLLETDLGASDPARDPDDASQAGGDSRRASKDGSSGPPKEVERSPADRVHTAPPAAPGGAAAEPGAPLKPVVYRMRYHRWLYVLALFISNAEEFREKRDTALRTFAANKFRSEWELLWELLDPVFEGWGMAWDFVLGWESPLFTLGVMLALLALAWHDMVHLVVPFCLMGNVVYILVSGSNSAQARRLKARARERRKRRSTMRAPKAQEMEAFTAKGQAAGVVGETLRPIKETVEGRGTATPPGAVPPPDSGRTPEGQATPTGGDKPRASLPEGGGEQDDGEDDDEDTQGGGIFRKVKSMQENAGNVQAKLHAYNTFLLKLRSIHNWTDPTRTKVWMLLVTALATFIALVPFRYIWAGLVIFVFTEPIRPPEKTIPQMLLIDFWRGLPLESNTHTNLQMAAIYKLQSKSKQE